MNTIVDIVLFLAAIASVFFLAKLSDVPFLVRGSVSLVAPGFMLTFLLHVLRYDQLLDYGLGLLGIGVTLSAITGFRYISTAPLTKAQRNQLLRRFAIGFAVTAVVVGLVAISIVKTHNYTKEKSQTTSVDSLKSEPTKQEVDDLKAWEELTKAQSQ